MRRRRSLRKTTPRRSPRSRSSCSTRRAFAFERKWPRASPRARGPSRKTHEPQSATCYRLATPSTAPAASRSASPRRGRAAKMPRRQKRERARSRDDGAGNRKRCRAARSSRTLPSLGGFAAWRLSSRSPVCATSALGGPRLLADLRGRREREAHVDGDVLVELERLVGAVDLLVREVPVGARATRVEPGAVPRVGQGAVLDAE